MADVKRLKTENAGLEYRKSRGALGAVLADGLAKILNNSTSALDEISFAAIPSRILNVFAISNANLLISTGFASDDDNRKLTKSRKPSGSSVFFVATTYSLPWLQALRA